MLARLKAAWHALCGAGVALAPEAARAGVLTDGSLILMSRTIGTLVLSPASTALLRDVLAHGPHDVRVTPWGQDS